MDDDKVGPLHSHLRELSAQLSGAMGAVDRMHDDLLSRTDDLANNQQKVEQEVSAIRRDLTSFIERNAREMSNLTAVAKLVNVRAELDRRFGQYRAVRRNAQGLLLAMDNDLAEDATTTLIAETMTIDAPGYWLASMINAAAAWLRDEPGATQRALLHAIELDRGKSALYAGLLNARYRRLSATGEWMMLYLDEQDPLFLTSDFVVVLDAAVVGAFGVKTREKVGNWCMHQFHTLNADFGTAQAQVTRWSAMLNTYADALDAEPGFASTFPTLDRISAESPSVADHFRRSQSFHLMHEALGDSEPTPEANPPSWRQMIDKILDNLTRLPEPEERKLRGQERDLLSIIDREGDLQLAKQDRQLETPLEEPHADLLTLLANVAQRPDRYSISSKTVQLARHLSGKPIVDAIRDLQRVGREQASAGIAVTIENWSGDLRYGPPDERLIAGLGTALDRLTEQDETREKHKAFLTSMAMITVGAIFSFAATLWAGRPATSAFAIVPLAVACIAALSFVVVLVRTPDRVLRAQEIGNRRKKEALSTLHEATMERNRLHEQWSERLSDGDAFVDYLNAIDSPRLTTDPDSIEEEARSAEAALAEMTAALGGHGPRLPLWNLSLRAK